MKFKAFPYLTIFLFLFAFVFSVFIRKSNLNQPFGRHHEWLSAHVLVTEKIWFEKGAAKFNFSPVFKHDTHPFKEATLFNVLTDKEGYEYYISYPPFCFIASYLFFKLLMIYPSIIGLQTFSLMIHFCCGILILLLGYELGNKKIKTDFFIPPLLGAMAYLFSTNNLWFHCNVYFADMLAQPFFIAGVWLIVKILKNDKVSNKSMAALFVVNFFFIYSEWIGIFFNVFAALTIFFVRFKELRSAAKIILTLFISAVLSLSLTIYQYLSLNGWEDFKKTETRKFEERSGRSENADYDFHNITNPAAWEKLKDHYIKGYSNNFSQLKILFILSVLISLFSLNTFINKNKIIAIFLAGLPVLLHIYIFFDFNATHDFSTLKSSFLFSLLVFILSDTIFSGLTNINNKLKYPALVYLSLHFIYFGYYSYKDYKFYNNPKDLSPYWELVGNKIKELRKFDDLIFVREWAIPEMIYYSEWIPFQQIEYSNAKEILINSPYNNGIYFYSDKLELKKIVRFNRFGDSTNLEMY